MANLQSLIIQDILEENRHFLPGKPPSESTIYDHFNKSILIDGLDAEEAYLILSTLPDNATKFFLSPLDKGLSGAKVYSCKYDVAGNRASKAFVLKLGVINKILREYEAIEAFVNPHLHGILSPIFRKGEKKGLVIQELAGLTTNSSLLSLKQYIREKTNPEKIIDRLFKKRLGNWYQNRLLKDRYFFKLSDLFEWHLKKAPKEFVYPNNWSDLQIWTREETGHKWQDIESLLTSIKQVKIESPSTIVHGDLHSQNILIDENDECFPIDFYWCHDNSSPIIDLVMLECSIKFLVFPHRADLRSLMKMEDVLFDNPYPFFHIGDIPYKEEILKSILCISEIRKIAMEFFKLDFNDYRFALWMMTYVHFNNLSLNRPYLLSSLQIISSKIMPLLSLKTLTIESELGPYDHIYANKADRIIWGNNPGRLMKKIKISKSDEVLDIGCGDGLNSFYLEQMGCHVTGVDISVLALEGLKKRFELNHLTQRGSYFQHDIETLELKTKFDIIVSYGLFHCLTKSKRVDVHKKIQESLKEGGHILFCSLIEGLELPKNHSNDKIILASESEILELFPHQNWTIEFEEMNKINDKHPPLILEHEHMVKWIVAKKKFEQKFGV